MEMAFIQQSLPKPTFPGVSDLNGLNLNITMPGTCVDPQTHGTKLPVFVFIHGGGFAIGANWWPQYDGSTLVRLSVKQKQPMIAININYRTGALGFLTSPTLRKSGYKPNNGLRDQRTALQWIKTHIAGFGGDPNNITVAGESAGGGKSQCLSGRVVLTIAHTCHFQHNSFHRPFTVFRSATGRPTRYVRWLSTSDRSSSYASR
jgi:acetyl esterase/lipase